MATWPKPGDRPHPKAKQNAELLHVWNAVQCMELGTAGRQHWSTLADAINMVEALCDLGKFDAATVMPAVHVAIAGMQGAMNDTSAPMGMDGLHLEALKAVCQRYDDALFKFSVNVLLAAKTRFLEVVQEHRAAGADSAADLVVCA